MRSEIYNPASRPASHVGTVDQRNSPLVLVGKVVLVGVLGVLCLVLAAYLFRDRVATALVGFALDRTEVECTHPDVAISSALDRIALAPIDCSNPSGPVARGRTSGETEIRLAHGSVRSVFTPSATIELRDRDVSHAETNTLGDVSTILGARKMLVAGMLDAQSLYSTDSPPITVEKLVVHRAGKREATLHEFEKNADGDWDRMFARRVEAPGMGDVASIRNFEMKITPKRGQLSTDLYLGKPEPSDEPDLTVKMSGARLDTAEPHFELKAK